MKNYKILHVANRAEKYLGKRYYSYAYKMNNGFVRNGHCVVWFSDRDVARTNSIVPFRVFGVNSCNRKLLETCENFRPDILVIAHADIIKNHTLRDIKDKYGCIIVQYNFDPFHEHNIEIMKHRNGFVDFNFITTGGSVLKKYAAEGTKYAFFPNPVDRSIDCLENYLHDDLPVDALFVGQTSNFVDKSDLRTQIPKLINALPNNKISSFNGVWGDAYLRLLSKAKIGLNLSIYVSPNSETDGDGSHHYLYSSDRISQYLGNGLLTFSEKKFCLSDLYGKDCLIEVDGFDDLKDKVEFFCRRDDLRKKKAAYSYWLVHERFNERIVTKYIIDIATGKSLNFDYSWPTDVYCQG